MKIPILLLLVAIKSLLSAELNAEEGEKKVNAEEAQSLDEFLNGKKSESLLTDKECNKILSISRQIEWNRDYKCEETGWNKISEEDETLLSKGAGYRDWIAMRALQTLYENRKDYVKLQIITRQVIEKYIKEGDYETAFWNAINLFTNDTNSDELREYGWWTAKNLFVEKKLNGSFEGVEEILPFLTDYENPVNFLWAFGYRTKSIKRPSFHVVDELLAYHLIEQWIKVYPGRGLYWKGRLSESSSFKNMPEAFKCYREGAMLKEKYCIHKVVEFIREGKGVVASISEELIWRLAAQALESDPDDEWGVLNKQRTLLLESSLTSSQVGLESLRLSANKLVAQINETSSANKKTKPSKGSTLSLGTGFIISTDGIILTACHVIKDCKKISVNQADGSLPARILAKDEENDIAILKVDGLASKTYLPFSKAEPKQGDKISTFGFPHSNIEGRDCKFSSGEISSLIGLGSDKRYLRLNLQISPGNSGGPLLDASNHIIGILTAKLDAIKMFEETGDLPTGVSYAVKSEWILRLLNTNGLSKKISFNESANKPSESIVLISVE